MDPITAMIIGALVLTTCAKVGLAATSDAVTTARASKAGQWDWISQDRERRAVARQSWVRAWDSVRAARHKAAGGDGEFRPGARRYFGDLYHGFWEDRLDRRTKKRAARPEYVCDPNRPGLAQRLDDAVLGKVEQIRRSRGWATTKQAARRPVDPVPAKADRPPAAPVDVVPLEPVPALAVDTGDVPVGTVRHTDAGREQWDGADWWPLREQPKPEVVPAPVVERVATPSKEAPMSAPTGEAVNYETTVSELEALANEQRGHVDYCQAALAAIGQAKGAINNMQESYRASAAAASLTSEHLAAKNLDGVTLANAGTTVDAMPAGAVDAMYDELEAMEAAASARLADAEVALASTETNLTHIQATYGDAHATVAGNLSGDSSFLDSGGGMAASPAPAMASSAHPANS